MRSTRGHQAPSIPSPRESDRHSRTGSLAFLPLAASGCTRSVLAVKLDRPAGARRRSAQPSPARCPHPEMNPTTCWQRKARLERYSPNKLGALRCGYKAPRRHVGRAFASSASEGHARETVRHPVRHHAGPRQPTGVRVRTANPDYSDGLASIHISTWPMVYQSRCRRTATVLRTAATKSQGPVLRHRHRLRGRHRQGPARGAAPSPPPSPRPIGFTRPRRREQAV